jgi:ornithine carbamoyltransferase
MKDLLRIADLSPADLRHLVRLSEQVRQHPHSTPHLLDGDTVITYLARPSTRTRLSFGSAIAHLGGVPEIVGPDELQVGRGETIEDTARVVSRYARALVIRTLDDDDVRRFAAAASIPVVNAGTDQQHPCQALADLLTLRLQFGSLPGLKVAYLGAGNNVVHSLMEACALAGIDIAVATPVGSEPDQHIEDLASALAARSGSIVHVTHDPLVAASGANAVYTDVWLSMGESEEGRVTRREAIRTYQVNEAVMAEAADDAVFMHCSPAHRGEEVSAAVIDGATSVVLDEAENRMHAAQALLIALLSGQLEGAVARPVGAS